MYWSPLAIVALLSPMSLLLIDSSIKGSVILLLAACVVLLLRRDSAATRHLVWLVAVVAMLFVPLFSASLPQWNVLPSWVAISYGMDDQEVVLAKPSKDFVVVSENGNLVDLPILVGHDDDRVAADASQIAVIAMPQPVGATSADVSDLDAADAVREMNSQVSPDGWNWSKALPMIWLVGFGLLILRLLAARLLLWSNERRATVIASSTRAGALITHLGQTPDATNKSIIAVFRNADQQLGIRQDISLSLHCEKNIPLVWGLRKFRLLLQIAALNWSDEQLRSVMLHELAHVKRRDTVTQLLAQFACALHWFNPLVWFASWRLHVERERACDDMVLSNGVAASAYAEHLLDVATRLTSSPWTQACGLAMARRSSLESRLLAVLSQHHNRRSLTSLVVAVWLILGTSAAVPISIMGGVVAPAPTSNTETTHSVPSAKSSKAGVKLDDEVEDKLKWGKTINGLRAAIIIRDTPKVSNEIFIVVQNASENPIRIDDSADAHGQTLYIKRNGRIVSALSSTRSKAGGVLLQPRQTVSVPVFSPTSKVEQNGKMLSSILAKTTQNDPSITLYAKVNFENVASGTWKGTLQTGEVTGGKAAASNFKGGKKIVTGKTSGALAGGDPMPKSETAQALFKQWQTNARLNGKIPGGALRSLVKATSNFVELNSTDKRVPALTELLKRMDVSRDWTLQEAVDLLDDVTDVYDNLPKWASDLSRFSISDVIRTGTPLPDDLKAAPWGDAHASGLRVAWLLDPQAKEYRLNTPLKSRLLYHNNGNQTVVFRVVSWNQSGAHQATDTDGTKIKTQSTDWTTIGQVMAVRLAPGEFTEVIGAGIGVGPNRDSEDWRNTRVGTWIHAKAGDEVIFTPALMTTSGGEGLQTKVEDALWWSSYNTQRLERDSPLPDDDQERERILIRAVGDLFGEPPTSKEIETFLADKSPDATASLAKRLSERAGMKQVFEDLQSGSTTFRVLPIDPEAKNKPRLAIGPGRYELGDDIRLVIVGRGKVMDANLEFSAEDATTKTHLIKLPEGRGNWAIAWKRDLTEIWIAEPGVLRRVDFANTDLVTDVRIVAEDRQKAPRHFLDALQTTFEKKLDLPPPAADPR